jgi:hypothetical protein
MADGCNDDTERMIKQKFPEVGLTSGRRLEDPKGWAVRFGFQIDRFAPNKRFGIAWLSSRGG